MERIRFWSIAGKAWNLTLDNAQVFFLYWVLVVAEAIAGEFATDTVGNETVGAWIYLVTVLVDLGLTISLYRYVLSSLRGGRSYFPDRPVGTFARFLFSLLAIGVLCLLFGILAGLPLFAVGVSGIPDDPRHLLMGSALQVITGLFLVVVGLLPMLRFGFVLPAIVMRDPDSYSRSWRLSRGYTVKLLSALVIFIIPFVVWGIIWGATETLDSVPFRVANCIFASTVSLGMSVFFCVLYEALHRRERLMQEVAEREQQEDGGALGPDTP